MMNSYSYKSLLILSVYLLFSACSGSATGTDRVKSEAKTAVQSVAFSEDATSFIVASDLGRNGYFEQKKIAELMGQMAKKCDAEFIAAVGDTHHFMGVASVEDPLWSTNYELIYTHPELMIDWFAVCGNHEYRGNTQAMIDYSDVSRRWEMRSRYYAKELKVSKNERALLLFIDTTPMIDKYRNDSTDYPDAHKESYEAQLAWIDAELKGSDAQWKIVLGHHPVYAHTSKNESERTDLQVRLQPILDNHQVDLYVCGHIHNFQHIRMPNSNVDYVVNSSGSLSRKVEEVDGTLYCSELAGFSVVSMLDQQLIFTMLDGDGNSIYQFSRDKH